jgi:phosphate uptake regulator
MTDTLAMYDEAINMLEDTLAAFEKEDTALARSIFQKDEFLDKININATDMTVKYLEANPKDGYQALINLSVIRRLERVGDQSKNIAEETRILHQLFRIFQKRIFTFFRTETIHFILIVNRILNAGSHRHATIRIFLIVYHRGGINNFG